MSASCKNFIPKLAPSTMLIPKRNRIAVYSHLFKGEDSALARMRIHSLPLFCDFGVVVGSKGSLAGTTVCHGGAGERCGRNSGGTRSKLDQNAH